MRDYSTLVEMLRDRAWHQPQQTAYVFMGDGKTETGRLTYQALDQQARAIAAKLQSLSNQGDRALLVYPYTAGLEFIAAYFGCLYAGVIAVTNNPPRHRQGILKLQERVISSQSALVLTTRELGNQLQQQCDQNPELGAKLIQLPWLETDVIATEPALPWHEPDLDRATLAFLQYTSGSTGTPKGVMVTHGNILHNSAVIYQGFGHSENSRGVIWLPLFHDMGLVGGVIQPLYGNFPVLLMSPTPLMQKPILWLEAISRFGATTSGGPNFAYDLLCHKVTPKQMTDLDLSAWEVAFSGAEPIRAETLAQFSKTFAPCGFRHDAFYPCYGMAETTLFVSGGSKHEMPLIQYVDRSALDHNRVVPVTAETAGARATVSCGRTWLGDQVVIVNPDTLTPCAADQVGEIWMAGAGVGQGYWGQAEETTRTFQAYLADTGAGPYLRTGDLGFIQEGELFITGRIKDLMILWGQNRYPQHIEETVENSHPALRPNCGAAFSVEIGGEERLVIVYEVERRLLRRLPTTEIVGAMRQAIAEEFMSDVYAIVLIKPGTMPKTTSGKVQRRRCRTQFLDQTLAVVGEWQLPEGETSSITDLFNRAMTAPEQPS